MNLRYDEERSVVVLSVEELCAWALSGGSLDLRFGGRRGSVTTHRAPDAAVYRKLQAEAGMLYTPDVSLTHTVTFHDRCFELHGRVDGLLATDPLTLDDIRTVGARAFDLPPSPLHDAPSRCCAYFLCCKHHTETIRIRSIYVRKTDGKQNCLTQTHSKEALERFFFDLLERVAYRAEILCERQTVLLPSAAAARFPFSDVRTGQDTLIKACYGKIRAGKRLFAEAPTGIGKTVSTLYPAVRAVGEGYADKIFYLTAKSSARKEAFCTASRIFEAGAHLRTVVLTAREQLCPNEVAKRDLAGVSAHCNPQDCPRAKGFYDRCPSAVCALLSSQSGYSRSVVERTAEQFGICPYEFQLELSEFCDIIICDYNYVFDPQTYLRRYFSADLETRGRYILLVDEAHNLADRARDMYSASLNSADVTEALDSLDPNDPLRERLNALVVAMHGFRRLCSDTLERNANGVEHGYYLNHGVADETFCHLTAEVRTATEEWLRNVRRGEAAVASVGKLSAGLQRFGTIAELFDRAFLTFIESEGDRQTIRLICMDPSRVLNVRMQRAYASVLFSATLTPLEYFSDILGGGKGASRLSLPSPFDSRRFYLSAVTGISTRYEDRETSCKKICSVIAAVASAKSGNYIVCFPSYDYMEKVYGLMRKKYPDVTLFCQSRGMSASEKERFLETFAEDRTLRIGFCVLGGSFSEGVDLPGRRLIGAVIVGTGLPGISNERNLLRDYYETTRERGYDYAYVYPGMNRVMQAAGRVIRREDDRGVVVLIDDRYADARLQAIFPEHWKHIEYAGNASELAESVRTFWKNA